MSYLTAPRSQLTHIALPFTYTFSFGAIAGVTELLVSLPECNGVLNMWNQASEMPEIPPNSGLHLCAVRGMIPAVLTASAALSPRCGQDQAAARGRQGRDGNGRYVQEHRGYSGVCRTLTICFDWSEVPADEQRVEVVQRHNTALAHGGAQACYQVCVCPHSPRA